MVTPFTQGPLFKVHWNTLVPKPNPVTVLLGLVGVVMVPAPLTRVHCPVAGASGALPPRVELAAHTCWSAPALAFGLAGLKTVMLTSSCVVGGVQGPLLIVQRKVFTPTERPLTVVLRWVALAKVPVPLTTVHRPVAGKVTALPARVALVVGWHSCWSGPALAAGCALLNTKTVTWSLVGGSQAPFTMVQRKVLAPMPNPLTAVVGLFAFANVPEPVTTVHVPTAGVTATFAARVAFVPLPGAPHRFWSGPALATGCAGLKAFTVTSSLVVPQVP